MKKIGSSMTQNRIARLTLGISSLISDRAWCPMSGKLLLDGTTFMFFLTDEENTRVRFCIEDFLIGGSAVIWQPHERTSHLLPSLNAGWTLALDGDDLVIFQRVVFPEIGVIDVLTELPQGRVIVASVQRVSAWDDTPFGITAPLAS